MHYKIGSDAKTVRLVKENFDRIGELAAQGKNEEAEALLSSCYFAVNRPFRAEFRAFLKNEDSR